MQVQVKLNLEMLVFQEEEAKPETLGEKSSEQGEIQHETQPTYDTRLELNPD